MISDRANKWTDASVRKLVAPASKPDFIHWDPELPSFGVRLRGGRSSFVVQYRIGRKQRRESLGDVRKLELKDAREIARKRFAQVELHIDPVADRERLEAEQAAEANTFLKAAEEYLDARVSKMRPNTYIAAKRYLLDHCRPLHKKGVTKVTFEEVAGLLRDLVRDHGPTSAARARGTLGAFFMWAMRQAKVKANPVIGTENPIEGKEPRDRVLTDDEIRAIWCHCGEDDFGRIVRVLLLTACRRDEIGALRWSELDMDAGKITFPKDRIKSKRTFVLPLPETAREILRHIPRRHGRETVFGGGPSGFNAWSYNTLRLNAAITTAAGKSLAPWRLHDLRRTVRTRLGKLGVLPHIAELVLNHAGHKSGIGGVYDHHTYEAEIGEALRKWEAHLLAIVAPDDNVIPLRRVEV
ncbi:site-specific integrase [Bradyrhizobium sp. WSM2793]|uniref:tyrosine-type recombinase/integrase n=1 Tax=Bradyrhizobium sp. WSM2793 TaxID=1038866 RepID=UPI000380FE01|nr:tyrosine-type recombinase/integrase [Bradyrhizobium sp. WSM2793]